MAMAMAQAHEHSQSPSYSQDSPPSGSPHHNSSSSAGLTYSSHPNAKDPPISAAEASKLKRTACVLCRKRKLRCDGVRPACGTCSRLDHNCEYDEIRKKSGPKRGYVKALEARLAQVETLLKTQDGSSNNTFGTSAKDVEDLVGLGMADPADLSCMEPVTSRMNSYGYPDNVQVVQPDARPDQNNSPQQQQDTTAATGDGQFTFDLIALGLEEPLPTSDITSELTELFFLKVYPSLPMIHQARFYAAMNLAPHMRPPVCLRYAMWALASGTSDKYELSQKHFYQRARKYLELDEMKGFGQSILTLAHCQAWVLVAMYEFKNMFFPRAWMSTGRAIRLTQMLSLHRLDGVGLDVKMTVPPPRDWTEREERRRTFWLTYWADRCASIGTGWPMSFEEKDILTNLPASNEAFQNSQPARTVSLADALESIDEDFSSISGCVLMATLFGRNLTHLHRPEPDDNEDDLNGKFWQRHRSIDNILLNIKLTLPDQLRIPLGINDPNVVFLNMCLHASAICLHQAAIFKAERHKLPPSIAGESKMRCIAAASEIATIMRTVSHMDLIQMNPFTAFCLYVSARVFVQFLRAKPGEHQVSSSLRFLLSAMHAMTKKNPLTESFIAQLELDMDGAGIENPHKIRALDRVRERGVPEYNEPEKLAKAPWGVHSLSRDDEDARGAMLRDKEVQNKCIGILPVISKQGANHGTGQPEMHPDGQRDSPMALPNTRTPVTQQRMGAPTPHSKEVPFGHAHISGVFPYEPALRGQEAMEVMDDGSVSTGQNKQGSGGSSVFTPPGSEPSMDDGSQKHGGHQQQQQQQQQQTMETTASSSSYNFTGQYPESMMQGNGMNMEDFSQFMPATPRTQWQQAMGQGVQLADGWGSVPTGLTPAGSGMEAEEWAKMLDNVTGWEGGEPLLQDNWNPGGM